MAGAATLALVDLTAAPARAADTSPAVTDVGEVLVTATKREARLRDVPTSVSVTTGAQLDAVGPVTNTEDLVSAVPGARFNNLANPLLSEVSLRGSGTQRATGADSSVGIYANGVYVGFSGTGGRNFAPIDSFDVDRVEVLSGPQGALYGRNAEFGVINLVSAKPAFADTGLAQGNYTFETDQWIGKVVLNHKFNDNWAVRLGVQDTEQNKGFVYNPTEDQYYDHTSGYVIRGQVRYRNEGLDVTLLAQRQDLHLPSFWSASTFQPVNTATGFPGNPNFPLGFIQDPRSIPQNGTNFAGLDVDNVVLTLQYDLGWAHLVSTSSYRKTDVVQQVDNDNIDLDTLISLQRLGERGTWPFSQNDNRGSTKSWYEDIHLAGAPLMDGQLTWLAGLELLSQPQTLVLTTTQNPCATSRAPNLVIGQAVCSGTPAAPVCTPVLGPTCPAIVSPFGSTRYVDAKYKSWAPYVSLEYKLPGGFKLGGDLRYTKDKKDALSQTRQFGTDLPYPFLTGGVIPDTTYALNKGNWTYAATVSYQIPGTSGDLAYAKVGTGYRVGGFNFGNSPTKILTTPFPAGIVAAPNYAPVTNTYDNETSISYELGFKGAVGPRTFFTFAAYWQETKDALAAVGDGCTATNACLAANTNYVVNAGTVHGYGFEVQFDTSLDVAGGVLALQSAGSNQSAKYHSLPATGENGQKLNGIPLVDTQIAQNPRWLVDVTANYTHPLGDKLEAFANVRFHGQWGGIQDPVVSALEAFHMDDYQDVDLRAGVRFGRLETAVLVRNLTNETHRLAQFQSAGTNTKTGALVAVQSQQRLSLPRTFGVEANYRW